MRIRFVGLGIVLAVASCTAISVSAAGGGMDGGGGNVVILPDDTVVLADPYIPREGDVGQLDEKLLAEIERAGRFLVRYGADKLDGYPNDAYDDPVFVSQYDSRFVQDQVLDPLIEFRFVKTLPNIEVCHDDPLKPLPPGTTHELVACTEGPVTWIREDLFRRMTVRQQAITIIHERLHALTQPFPIEFIADITQALDTILKLYNDQLQDKRPRLSDDQVKQIRVMMKRIVQMGLAVKRSGSDVQSRDVFLDHWVVVQNGGGLAHQNAKVAANAYVGVGSLIGAGSELADGSVVLNSSCYDLKFEGFQYEDRVGPALSVSCSLAKGAKLAQSLFTVGSYFFRSWTGGTAKVVLQTGASISNSNINIPLNDKVSEQISLDEGASIVDSHFVTVGRIRLGKRALLKSFRFYSNISDGPIYGMAEVYPPYLELGDGASLSDNADGIHNVTGVAKDFNGPHEEAPTLSVAPGAQVDMRKVDALCGAVDFAGYRLQGVTRVQNEQDFVANQICW